MGKGIYYLGGRAERRFLGSNINHGKLNSLERCPDIINSHDCSFFNQQQELIIKSCDELAEDDDDDDDEPSKAELQDDRRIYWESQEFLLQEILEQYKSVGSKLRDEIIKQIEIARESNFCNCADNNDDKELMRFGGRCIQCLRRAAVTQLSSRWFRAALCLSKWNRTHKTPPGTHQYIQVIVSTQGRRKQIPFLVELGFRDEFRMAKPQKPVETTTS